jgi:glycosyltransferase involved in cell wall biosynthesis
MKLIIQIPCWNEEKTIAETIRSIPRKIYGIDCVEIIAIDDGSHDRTAIVAKEAGADEIVYLPRHMGLAAAFSTGITTAIQRGADIVVNTDADLQYPSHYIPKLVKSIVDNKADIVIGDRLSHETKPFPPFKMFLEKLGSFIVRIVSGTTVRDAASGFRAFSRDALLSMNIHNKFTYTIESILLAGVKKYRIDNITIPTNKKKRNSRLFNNIGQYIYRSAITLIRIFLMYHPLKFFLTAGSFFMSLAFLLGARFLYFFYLGQGNGHIQSLILLAVLAIMGFQCIILGLLADVVAANRRLLEQIRLNQLIQNNNSVKQDTLLIG